MRSVSLLLCFLVLLAASCSSTFSGYRQTPQTPAEILKGDDDDEAFPELRQIETPGTPDKPGAKSSAMSAPSPALVEVVEPATEAPQLEPKSDVKEDIASINLPALLTTAVPFQSTEYRRVWIAPHQNQFGDAVHGHTCEILFQEAKFRPRPVPVEPPTAPVIIRTEERHTPPSPFTRPQAPDQRRGQTVPRSTPMAPLSAPKLPVQPRGQAGPSSSAVPIHLQEYLQRMGVGNARQ